MEEEEAPKPKVDSKFRFVLVAAQRAEQLMRGARPKIESKGKPTRTAMGEVDGGHVEWNYGPAPIPEPAEPSAEPTAEAEEVH